MWCCLLLAVLLQADAGTTQTGAYSDRELIRCKSRHCEGVETTTLNSTSLECCKHEFMSSVMFQVTGVYKVRFTAATCTAEKCCLNALSNEYNVTLTEYATHVGIYIKTQLNNSVRPRCKESGNKIATTEVVCEYPNQDGTMWNLLKDRKSMCTACEAGTRYNSSSNKCENCNKGTYSDTSAATECKTCPNGTHTDSEGASVCDCDRGYKQDGKGCSPCPPGTYSDTSAATTCRKCDRGTYSDTSAATECRKCDRGTYSDTSAATECKTCPKGTHTDSEGASVCDCDRGLVRSDVDPSVCEYCPAGHTTYRYAQDTCIGPQLHGMDLHRNHLLTVPVSYDTLGNLNGEITTWESTGDWLLKKKNGGRAGRIKQKYTLSYGIGRRQINIGWKTTKVEPIIRNFYCYDGADNGERYRGYANKTSSGSDCTGPYCKTANGVRVCYCRNRIPDKYTSPYCNTADKGIQYCDIPECKREEEVTECEYEEEKVVPVTNLTRESGSVTEVQFPDLNSSQRTCDKLGGACTGVWLLNNGNFKLTNLRPVSLNGAADGGTASFFAKSPDCDFPYYEYYFTQSYARTRSLRTHAVENDDLF